MNMRRQDDVPDNNHDMILGELRGQQRELIHGMNNLSQKFDALSREVIGLGPIAVDVADLKLRMSAVEAERNQRQGREGVLHALIQSRALGWIAGGALTIWAVLSGRVDV